MTVMPRERDWTSDDGVTITYLTYETMLSRSVSEKIRPLYSRRSADDPTMLEIDEGPYAFYKAMPAIIGVKVSDEGPLWGHILKEEINRADWLVDPVADYKRIMRLTPAEVLALSYKGFQATRETKHLAPLPLQEVGPQSPELDLEAMAQAEEEGPHDKSHPTTPGGKRSRGKSSPVLKASFVQGQKAT